MIVYLDLVIFINFIFDSTILFTVDLLLKRNVRIKRILLGGLVGELSLVTFLIKFNNITLNIFKIVLSILMCIVVFSYKDVKYTFYNTVYLYLVGMILGGFEYYLYNEFKIGSTLGYKYLILILVSPIILIVYYKLSKSLKNNYNNRHRVRILYDGKEFLGTGFLDSGNKLVSPLNGDIIILVEREYILYHKLKVFPVCYNALNYTGIIECFRPQGVYIDDVLYKNIIVGLSNVKFNMDGVNVLLNSLMEGI